uniref:Uncharacterized protein n=1 Tax=Anguilla anguilla TaxID=7936 RepID=A0A0E9QUC5_ANGAN
MFFIFIWKFGRNLYKAFCLHFKLFLHPYILYGLYLFNVFNYV